MSGIMSDLQKLKQGQAAAAYLGYGSLAAAILAMLGFLYILFRVKTTGKGSMGSQKN